VYSAVEAPNDSNIHLVVPEVDGRTGEKDSAFSFNLETSQSFNPSGIASSADRSQVNSQSLPTVNLPPPGSDPTELIRNESEHQQPVNGAMLHQDQDLPVNDHGFATTASLSSPGINALAEVSGNEALDAAIQFSDRSNGYCSFPSFGFQASTEFGIGELDWLNFELDSPESLLIENEPTRGPVMNDDDSMQFSRLPLLNGTLETATHQADARPPDHTAYNQDLSLSLPKPSPSASNQRREQWPFDYTAKTDTRKIQLPPLRQILESTVRPKGSINRDTLHSLIELLSSPFLPSLDETLDIHIMPAIVLLKQFLNLYLTEFNSVIPMIYVPTWDISKCPTVLLAAMACIGAGFSDAEGSLELQASLSEISLQTLSWLVSTMAIYAFLFPCLNATD
jgi:hypothetical protein